MKNLIQRPKTSNGAFNVGYRAGISRKSSSASGTELPVATVGFRRIQSRRHKYSRADTKKLAQFAGHRCTDLAFARQNR